MDGGEFAPDHAHGMQKRELVGIGIGFEGSLVHQTAHREVGRTWDPAAIIAGDLATAEDVAKIRAKLGLDQPLLIQF